MPVSADNSRPLRLVILHTVPFESFADDVTAEVVGIIKQRAPQVEVATHDVAKVRLYTCGGCNASATSAPCRVNDFESRYYKPDDQLVSILDSIRRSDMLLFVGTVRARGLNATAQNLLERFECTHHRLKESAPFKGKVLGSIIASGTPGAWNVAGGITSLLNHYGFVIPAYGSISLSSEGHPKQDENTDDDETTEDVTTAAQHDILGKEETRESINALANSMVATAKTMLMGGP